MEIPGNFVHYQTHVSCIDDEHLRLFAAIKELIETGAHDDACKVCDLLDEHARNEETQMALTGYPYYEMHKADHTRRFRIIKEKILKSQQFAMHQHLLSTVWQDFLHHVEWYDMQYSKWLMQDSK